MFTQVCFRQVITLSFFILSALSDSHTHVTEANIPGTNIETSTISSTVYPYSTYGTVLHRSQSNSDPVSNVSLEPTANTMIPNTSNLVSDVETTRDSLNTNLPSMINPIMSVTPSNSNRTDPAIYTTPTSRSSQNIMDDVTSKYLIQTTRTAQPGITGPNAISTEPAVSSDVMDAVYATPTNSSTPVEANPTVLTSKSGALTSILTKLTSYNTKSTTPTTGFTSPTSNHTIPTTHSTILTTNSMSHTINSTTRTTKSTTPTTIYTSPTTIPTTPNNIPATTEMIGQPSTVSDLVKRINDYKINMEGEDDSGIKSASLIVANPSTTSISFKSKKNAPQNTIYKKHILILTAFFVFVIGFVGIIGNTVGIVSLLLQPRLRRNPSSAFMVNLLASLLPICVLGMPGYGVLMLQLAVYKELFVSEETMVAVFTMGLALSQVHIHTLCAIAINRLVAVVWPGTYKRLMRPGVVKVYLAVVWVYSGLLWIPLCNGGTYGLSYDPEELMVSMGKYGVSELYKKRARFRKTLHVFFTYLLPIIVISVCYIAMYTKVRRSRMRREERAKNSGGGGEHEARQWDDHVTRTVLVIFLVLLVCSVPHVVIHAVHLHETHPHSWLLLHVVFWLQFCVDPFIYMLMSQHYREACGDTLRRFLPHMSVLQVSNQGERRVDATDNSCPAPGSKYRANDERVVWYVDEAETVLQGQPET